MALKFISDQMDFLAVPYEFGEWTSDEKDTYFVGEITEDEPLTEDGATNSTLFLTGFHRGKYIVLDEFKNKIKKHFDYVNGLRSKTEDGGAIAVFYGGAFPIPSGEKDLKKIQITLKIKEWKGVL